MNRHALETVTGPQSTEEMLQLQRLSMLGKLACGIGHDMANLTMLLGFRLAKIEPALAHDPDALKLFKEVVQTIGTLQELSRRMVHLSHERRSQPCVVDATAAVRSILALFSGACGKGIRTMVSCPAVPANVRCDPVLLEQVLLNLLLNAREAIPDRGHVSAKVSLCTLSETAEIVQAAAAEATHVLLSIQDDGCGMSSDVLARAFDPFFTTKSCGTGMGLSVVRNAVTEMGGLLRIRSEVGKGTHVEVLLKRWVEK